MWVARSRIIQSLLVGACCGLGQTFAQGAYSIQVLHDFETNSPSSLVAAPDGGFYGTTKPGTVFRADLHGAITTLAFVDRSIGPDPSGLIVGNDGNLYGLCTFGGVGSGSIFAFTPPGSGYNPLRLLHVFSDADGFQPWGKLLQASDGNIYGTTISGGPTFLGTLFRMSPDGSTFSTLYSFSNLTGHQANGALLETPNGWLYGSTSLDNTTIFRINFAGELTIVTNLSTATGFGLVRLILARDGSIWGTASSGGLYNKGTVVRLSTNGLLTVVASLGEKDGSFPRGVTQGLDGNFYGVTQANGENGMGGHGTIFTITPEGELSTIANFDGLNGAGPQVPLVLGGDGNLYGVAQAGGRFGSGTFFRLVRTPELAISRGPGGPLRVAWSCFATGNYRLESKGDLSEADWLPVTEITVPQQGTSLTNFFSGTGEGYFRVVLLP